MFAYPYPYALKGHYCPLTRGVVVGNIWRGEKKLHTSKRIFVTREGGKISFWVIGIKVIFS